MLELAWSLLRRLGGPSGLFLGLACLVPLLLWQCGNSRLEDLRERHRALQAECAALQAGLDNCRAAAGLSDAVLLDRVREARDLADKYNRLRAEAARALLPAKETDDEDRNRSYQDWCAQPLPAHVRGLLSGPPAPGVLP